MGPDAEADKPDADSRRNHHRISEDRFSEKTGMISETKAKAGITRM